MSVCVVCPYCSGRPGNNRLGQWDSVCDWCAKMSPEVAQELDKIKNLRYEARRLGDEADTLERDLLLRLAGRVNTCTHERWKGRKYYACDDCGEVIPKEDR